MKLFDTLLATKRKFRCEKSRIWDEMTRHQKAGANSPVSKSIKRFIKPPEWHTMERKKQTKSCNYPGRNAKIKSLKVFWLHQSQRGASN